MALSLSRRLRERRAAGEYELSMPGTRKRRRRNLPLTFWEAPKEGRGLYLLPDSRGPGFRLSTPLWGSLSGSRQLQLVRGIGPKTEARLREAGIVWLTDLLDHQRFGREAAQVLKAIEARDGVSYPLRGLRLGRGCTVFTGGVCFS